MNQGQASNESELEINFTAPPKKYQLTRIGLMTELKKLGFKRWGTASAKWSEAFFFANSQDTLLVLFRKRGINILKTPEKIPDMLNRYRKLMVHTSVEGAEFADYCYSENPINIHVRTLLMAQRFVSNLIIDPTFFCHAGLGNKEWAEEHGQLSKRKNNRNSDNSTKDIYDAISLGDGEDAYLGDGIWIGSSGRTYDRGR